METNEELRAMVKSVADKLNAIGDGNNPYEDPSYGYVWGEDGRTVEEDMAPMDVFMMDEMIDLRFLVDSDAEYYGALIYVTVGGPTIWVDVRAHAVKGSWGTATAEWGITSRAVDALDMECEENWNSIRRSYCN